MSMSLACKTIHVSPSPGQYNSDSVEVIVSQNGCVQNDQGQILATELNLMEMTDVEYTHLQHIIQSHMEAQATDPDGTGETQFNSTVFTVGSPVPHSTTMKVEAEYTARSPTNTPPDAASTSTDEQYSMPDSNQQGQVDIQQIKLVLINDPNVISGERTPTTCGEVPCSVLAKIRNAADAARDQGVETYDNSSVPLHSRPNPPARVRLEKRFNCTPCDIPRQQDTQSAALSNFLTMLHHSSEAQEAAMHAQTQKWVRSDRGNPIELSYPYGGNMFNPIAGIRGQGFGNIPHMLEPNKHPGLIIPKNFTFTYRQEKVNEMAPCMNHTNPTEDQVWVKLESDVQARPAPPAKRARIRGPRSLKAPNDASGSADVKGSGRAGVGTRKRGGPPVETSQRRERHNSKERDRRRRIRFCCDELNLLVPFCNHETDKATTLQWTTAFLKYIREVYGDSIKKEFQSTFCGKTGLRIKPSGISGQVLVHQETPNTPGAPQDVEQ